MSEVIKVTPRFLKFDENTLKDLPCFLDQPSDDKVNFRWPTLEDLRALPPSTTLKLKEIRAKRVKGSAMTAIQLVFEGGIESPLFDSKQANATEIKSYPVPDKRIEKVTGKQCDSALRKLTLKFDDNSTLTVFSESDHVTDDDREIPPGHAIVGIYGQLDS